MSLRETETPHNLPVDLKDQWRYRAMTYIIAGQADLSMQIEPFVGRLFMYPFRGTIFTFTGVGPIAIDLKNCIGDDVNSPYRIPSSAEIIALGIQRKTWSLSAPSEDIPVRLLDPTTENELPFQQPNVRRFDPRIYRELLDSYIRNMVVGLNLELLGLTRQDVVSGNFTQEVITKIHETRESIQREFRVEPVLPNPHDEVLLFPHGKIHALISPRRRLNPNGGGEGIVYLVDMAYLDPQGDARLIGAVEKEIRYQDMVKNPLTTPSVQVAKFEDLSQGEVKTYPWVYRDIEDRKLYAPDQTEDGQRELVDLAVHRGQLPVWFLENRLEIARQYVQNAKKLDACGYHASSDAYFVLGPKANGESVKVIVGDLGQGLTKGAGRSIYSIYHAFVKKRQLLTYEEWNALLV